MEKQYFNEKAEQWDTPFRIERAAKLADAIRVQLKSTDRKALDFGCGTGLLALNLLKDLPDLSVTDNSEEMVSVLQRKLEQNGTALDIIPTANLGEDCYFGRFDLIYSSMVFHHIRKVEDEMLKLRRLIVKGGRFLMIDLNPVAPEFHADFPDFDGHHGFSREEIAKHFTRCGFTDLMITDCFESFRLVNGKEIPYSLFLAGGTK